MVTGYSGVGKDSIIDAFMAKKPHFRRLVTCTDRLPRPGEIDGTHYYFVAPETLDQMHLRGELVEKPLVYGTSRKATPKKEFSKVIYENASLIWRIESSLAASVASGAFYEAQFSEAEAHILKKVSVVVFITAERKAIEERRKRRDAEKYDPKDFAMRDEQDRLILETHGHHFKHIIENPDQKIEVALEKIVNILGG